MRDNNVAAGTSQSPGQDPPSVDFRWIVQEEAEAIVVYDADFRYRYMNREAERWLGHTLDELRGRVAWDVFPDAVGTPTYHAQVEAMRTRRPSRYEADFRPLGLVFEAHCQPCIGDDGGLVVRWRDIWAQKEAEATVLRQAETLRQGEERLRLAVEAGHLGAWDMNAETGRASIDAAVAAMFGRDDAREVGGAEWAAWIHPADREQTLAQFAQSVAGGGGEYRAEYRALWPDGKTVRWIAVHAQIQRDAQEAATRIVGICRDITQERSVQDARDAALAQLQAVLRAASDGVIVSDLSGNIRLMNPAALDLHGFSSVSEAQRHLSQLAGVFLLETAQGQSLPVVKWPLARLMRGETFTDYELLIRRDDGERRRWVAYSGSVARDADGRALLLVLTLRDVTERRRLMEREAELRREVEAAAVRQRRFLREMLNAVTEGRLHLCDRADELPPRLPSGCDPIPLESCTLRLLRRDAMQAAFELGFGDERAQGLQMSVGEAAMNAVVHAGGGVGQVFQDAERGMVQVWVTDQGGGITEDALHRATLERGFSSAGTLGHGFWMMLKTADRVHLLTGPQGTTVVLEQDRDLPLPNWMQPREAVGSRAEGTEGRGLRK